MQYGTKQGHSADTLLSPINAIPTESLRFWPPESVEANANLFSSRPKVVI